MLFRSKIVERELRRNPYLTTGFYVRQIVRIGAAFLVGLLLFWVFPTLRNLSLPSAGTALRSTGIGFVAAIVLPVAAIVACITVVGIPIGILTLIGGAIGLYLSKIVVAQIIGRELFGASGTQPHPAATLIAGLVVVIIAINLPLLGGIVNLVLTLLGFGMLVTLLLAKYNAATATA